MGSCGAYVFVRPEDEWLLLVHRRSQDVAHPGLVAAPGGRVERVSCNFGALGVERGFECGARWTAVKELQEEAGLSLLPYTFFKLSSSQDHEERHINFAVKLDLIPSLTGPHEDHKFEVELGGMAGVGRPAGDGVHSWIAIEDLLGRGDLLPLSRAPLESFLNAVGSSSHTDDVSLSTPVLHAFSMRGRGRRFGTDVRGQPSPHFSADHDAKASPGSADPSESTQEERICVVPDNNTDCGGDGSLVCVFCNDEKEGVFQQSSSILSRLLPHGDLRETCSVEQAPGLQQALDNLEEQAWPFRGWRNLVERCTGGKYGGTRAVGFGSNKKKCQRAAKVALSIALAIGGAYIHSLDGLVEFHTLLQQAKHMKTLRIDHTSTSQEHTLSVEAASATALPQTCKDALSWMLGRWRDQRSMYEVIPCDECSLSVRTVRSNGEVRFTKRLIQHHGSRDEISWGAKQQYKLKFPLSEDCVDCMTWQPTRPGRSFHWQRVEESFEGALSPTWPNSPCKDAAWRSDTETKWNSWGQNTWRDRQRQEPRRDRSRSRN